MKKRKNQIRFLFSHLRFYEGLHKTFWGTTKKSQNKSSTWFFLFVRNWDGKAWRERNVCHLPKNVNKSCDSWVWLAWFAKKVVRCCQRSLWLDQRQIEIFWSKAVMWLWLEEEIPLAPQYLSLYSSIWLCFQIRNKSFRVWKHSRDLMHFKLWFNQKTPKTRES